MRHLRSLDKHSSENKVWASIDKPVEIQAPLSLLHKAKDLLATSYIPKSSLWVDADNQTLTCDGELAFSARTADLKVKTDFGEGWEDYVTSDAWSSIVKEADDKLSWKRGKGAGKSGKGKRPAPAK